MNLFSLPKDYIRRRRAVRRITNAAIITVLSLIAAYAITRPTGGPGFSAPRPTAKTILASSQQTPELPAPTSAITSLDAVSDRLEENGYNVGSGPLAVEEIPDIVLHDQKRNKDLHLRIFYPKDAGPFPVIVFSHGAGGSQSCCEALTRHWASYGYVTIQPTHEDSAVQRRHSGEEDIRLLQAVREALKKPAFWESRPLDISFVLDSLPRLEERTPGLASKLDTGHIGVGGHSMGSYTAEAIAGALIDLPGHGGTNFFDSRVKAVLCLSPQGPGQFGLTDHSFDKISLPYMGMTGSLDSLGPVASPTWHKTPFDRSQPGDKYHVFIEGANHMSFITAETALRSRAPQGEAILGYTNSASLAFWDAYLKNEQSAKSYLQSDTLQKSSHGAVKLFRR
jgi:predicted dienelactone hydrolase